MATHSGILAWKISWTEKPGGWGCKVSDTIECLTKTTRKTTIIIAIIISLVFLHTPFSISGEAL